MHLNKVWVPKLTYSACVGSNKPCVLLIVLFLWSSIVLVIGLLWKKEKDEVKVFCWRM